MIERSPPDLQSSMLPIAPQDPVLPELACLYGAAPYGYAVVIAMTDLKMI